MNMKTSVIEFRLYTISTWIFNATSMSRSSIKCLTKESIFVDYIVLEIFTITS